MENRISNIASIKEAKARKTYSEEEYVNFYLSQNLVEEWGKEAFACVLRNWYKTIRDAEAFEAQNGKEYTDYVAEEVENAPISEVDFSNGFIFAYFGKKHQLRCLNDTIVIENVPEGNQSDAIVAAQTLSNSYGYIWVTYEELINEFESLR